MSHGRASLLRSSSEATAKLDEMYLHPDHPNFVRRNTNSGLLANSKFAQKPVPSTEQQTETNAPEFKCPK